MDINDRMLKIKTEEGLDKIIEVIDIMYEEVNNKNYIIYKDFDGSEAFISILVEKENEFLLETIEDYEEFKMVEQYELKKLDEENEERLKKQEPRFIKIALESYLERLKRKQIIQRKNKFSSKDIIEKLNKKINSLGQTAKVA